MKFVLDHASLWIGDGRRLDGHVVVRDGLVERVERGRFRGPGDVTDMDGAALSPGLIDIMVNGAFGQSVIDGDMTLLGREYLKLGVTSCQMCTGTRPWEVLARSIDNCSRAASYDGPDTTRVTGVYMEGPFLNSPGAHLPEHLKTPSPDHVRYVLDHFDRDMRMINVSPGIDHAVEAIGALRAAGKIVTMAHSDASAADVNACIDAGTSQLGHAWDNNDGRNTEAGSPQPTLEHVALLDPRVRFVHLIADGVHVHPVMVNLTVKCRGLESICVVSDALPCTGIREHETTYDDGRRVFRRDGAWRVGETGGLMGTALLLPDHFRNFVRMSGAAPHEAVRTVTGNPAAALGLDDRIGLLAPGRSADFAVWDDQLQIVRVWRAGVEVACHS
jgi:N-acetylglucosamine-6-phosphate deacetylase